MLGLKGRGSERLGLAPGRNPRALLTAPHLRRHPGPDRHPPPPAAYHHRPRRHGRGLQRGGAGSTQRVHAGRSDLRCGPRGAGDRGPDRRATALTGGGPIGTAVAL